MKVIKERNEHTGRKAASIAGRMMGTTAHHNIIPNDRVVVLQPTLVRAIRNLLKNLGMDSVLLVDLGSIAELRTVLGSDVTQRPDHAKKPANRKKAGK